jgi:hypothetical protein
MTIWRRVNACWISAGTRAQAHGRTTAHTHTHTHAHTQKYGFMNASQCYVIPALPVFFIYSRH